MQEQIKPLSAATPDRKPAAGAGPAIARDPFTLMLQLSAFFFVSRAVQAVAELGVADAVGERETPVAAVTAQAGADEDALRRVLRLLASFDVFALDGATVRHTPASALLCADHPVSLRDFARMFAQRVNWLAADGLLHSLRSGEAAVPRAFPDGGFWGYLAQHPDEARVFDAAMKAKAHSQTGPILAAYDFSQFGSLADIGGGQGHFLRAALAAQPQLNGILFDQLPVIEATKSAGDAGGRLAFQAGDFFKDGLPHCDAYVIMETLRDWADAPARRIVSAIREAAPAHAKLLVVEQVVPEDDAPDWSKTLDIVMLALFAARQRTAEEYRTLLRDGGFALKREIDTGAGVSVFEAEPI